MNNYESLTNVYIEMINDALDTYIITTGEQYDIVKEAMNYSLRAGGKRIRGILVLEFCKMNGGDICKALPFACAIEMIHCYSLIHDDLPCMDDDDLRRGKPSCHKQFGEANALLAGDALLTLAFQVISSDSTANTLSDSICLRAVKILAVNAGVDGMVGGQVMDLINEGHQVDEQTLFQTHMKKTGALIQASCMIGSICANANVEIVEKSKNFGQNLGLAFQIIDDILDVVGNEKTLGKPLNSDSENKKTTFVTLYGLKSAKGIASETTQRAIDILEDFDNCDYIKNLAKRLLDRTN